MVKQERREEIDSSWSHHDPLYEGTEEDFKLKKDIEDSIARKLEELENSDIVDEMVRVEYIITVTMPGANGEVEVWLGGALEDQCVYTLAEGGWESVANRPRADFIKYAMQYCRNELSGRMFTGETFCDMCGNDNGTVDEDF